MISELRSPAKPLFCAARYQIQRGQQLALVTDETDLGVFDLQLRLRKLRSILNRLSNKILNRLHLFNVRNVQLICRNNPGIGHRRAHQARAAQIVLQNRFLLQDLRFGLSEFLLRSSNFRLGAYDFDRR